MKQQIIWVIILGWPKYLFGVFFHTVLWKNPNSFLANSISRTWWRSWGTDKGFAHGCKVRFCFGLSESTAYRLSFCYVSTTASNIHLHLLGWILSLWLWKREDSGICIPFPAASPAMPASELSHWSHRSHWGPRFLHCVQYCNFEIEIKCLFSCVV